MATTLNTAGPEVYHLGGATEAYYSILADGEDTIKEGDLIRINDAGKLDLAQPASAGAVHGMALEDATAETATKVLLFATDTVLKMQVIDGAEPEELLLGTAYTLEDGTDLWAVTATTTNGVAIIVGRAGEDTPWQIARGAWDEAVGTDNNSVLVRFSAGTLDAVAAAAT